MFQYINYLFRQDMEVSQGRLRSLTIRREHRRTSTSVPGLMWYLILTSAGDGVNSRPVILHNGTSTALHSQDASHLQDDVLRRGPA